MAQLSCRDRFARCATGRDVVELKMQSVSSRIKNMEVDAVYRTLPEAFVLNAIRLSVPMDCLSFNKSLAIGI